MTVRLHPVAAEYALAFGNRLREAAARPGEAAFQLLAWTALAAGLAWAWSRLDGDRLGLWVAGWVQTPWLSAAPLVLAAAWSMRRVLQATACALADGWWAAAPVPRAAIRAWLAVVASAVALGWVGLAVGLLHAIAAVARRPTPWLPLALDLVVPALLAGSALGALAAAIGPDRAGRAGYASHGLPLYGLPLPERLPELARWQRIEALRSFRAGGRIWPFLLLGLAIPAGLALPSLTGLVMLGLTLIWYAGVLQAAHAVIHAGHALLAAQPVPVASFARACVHYPAIATLVACGLGALALALQQAPWPFICGWLLALPAWTALDLVLVLRHRGSPRRAALALAVAAVSLVAGVQLYALALPVLWVALFAHALRALRASR